MTKNRIVKTMTATLYKECGGMMASVAALSSALGYNRKFVNDVIKRENCVAFGEGQRKKYYVAEVAEAFCRYVEDDHGND